jgi:hypothetical protein
VIAEELHARSLSDAPQRINGLFGWTRFDAVAHDPRMIRTAIVDDVAEISAMFRELAA